MDECILAWVVLSLYRCSSNTFCIVLGLHESFSTNTTILTIYFSTTTTIIHVCPAHWRAWPTRWRRDRRRRHWQRHAWRRPCWRRECLVAGIWRSHGFRIMPGGGIVLIGLQQPRNDATPTFGDISTACSLGPRCIGNLPRVRDLLQKLSNPRRLRV